MTRFIRGISSTGIDDCIRTKDYPHHLYLPRMLLRAKECNGGAVKQGIHVGYGEERIHTLNEMQLNQIILAQQE